ncbi:MAG: HEAT repeat domain-containing protein [Gemmataceae bacterium]
MTLGRSAVLFALAAALVSPSPTPAQSGGVQWIWFDEGDPLKDAPAGTRYFRKTLTLGGIVDVATLDITADDAFTVWVNGTKVGSGDTWKQIYRFDVKKFMAAGSNVIAVQATNTTKGAAGVMVKLGYVPSGQSGLVLVSDSSWKASDSLGAGWEGTRFDDSKWRPAKALGAVGKAGPWKNLQWPGGGDDRFTVPTGFRVETVAKNPKPGDPFSLVNMCFDHKGRLFVSQERGPILICSEPDASGVFQTVRPYCTQLKNCHGMCWIKGSLYLVGDGPGGTGLYCCKDTKGTDAIDTVEQLHKYKGGMGEHGPHAVLHGPDDKLYLIAGNHSWMQPDKLADNSPLRRWPNGQMGPDQGRIDTTEDVLLPRLNDARGHAANILAPGGTIWRADLDGKNMALVACGFRNHFDAAFSPDGELFTFDSDMEWDENLPWYRSVRVVHAPPGADFLWRTGAANTPNYYLDSLPPMAETGRGSPVGVEFYDHVAFGPKYKGSLFLGDWSIGAIWVVKPQRAGATFTGKAEKFCTGTPLNVTDLATGPDGALYFTMGGRNTQGGIYRIVSTEKTPAADVDSVQPLAPWGKHRDSFGQAPPRPVLRAMSQDGDPLVRAKSVEIVGRLAEPDAGKIIEQALRDSDPLVRRRACEALIRANVEPPVEAILPLLADKDQYLRTAARLVLQRIDPKKWADAILTGENDVVGREAVVALCKINRAQDYAGAIFDRLHHHTPEDGVQPLLDYLRCLQLALVHTKDRPGSVRGVALDLYEKFPHADAAVNREMAILLVDFRRTKVIDEPVHAKLLDAMVAASADRQQQIYLFYCLRLLHDGWTPEQKERLLAWFEGTKGWTGGASFSGFLENILRDLAPALTTSNADGVLKDAAKRPFATLTLIRSLPPEQIPASAAAYLRKLADDDPRQLDLAARLLARFPTAENWPYLIRALGSTNPLVVGEAFDALRTSDVKPKIDEPGPFRAALVGSKKLQARQKGKAIALLRHWTGGKKFGYETAQVNEELAAWGTWFNQSFPKELSVTGLGDTKPGEGKYKFDELLKFVEEDPAGMKGDAAKGRLAFEKANCLKCHKYGTEGEGLGPDLTTLSKRFKRRDVLESLVYPSKVISDQYRSTTITTKKGQRLDGIVAPTGDTVTVLISDGSKVVLKKSEIDEQFASLTSVMPELLLDLLTKQEIADLFAFLESEPVKK